MDFSTEEYINDLELIRQRSGELIHKANKQRMDELVREGLVGNGGTRNTIQRKKSSIASTASGAAASLALRTELKNCKSMATIIVGPTRTEFLLHTDLLTACSPFFAAALSGSFAEAESQTVALPEEAVPSFEYFAQWLYTRSLAHDTTNARGQPTYFVLLELYALADRLAVEGLRNAAVDRVAELAEQTNSVPTPSDTHILYDRIRDGAPMRRLVTDLFAFKKTDNLLETHRDNWNNKFLRDLVVTLKRPQKHALSRHALVEWKTRHGEKWTPYGCDVCKIPCQANRDWRCEECFRVFCRGCVIRGLSGCGWDWPKEGGCKPWLRDMCQYHEHGLTPSCHDEENKSGGKAAARVGSMP
ncbi:MAG: hypothetical protein M1822_007236 [Bathelium mastoideum]|nr:MAG: hypothetical protein M1822_007236 [Bathelium mastoideum]